MTIALAQMRVVDPSGTSHSSLQVSEFSIERDAHGKEDVSWVLDCIAPDGTVDPVAAAIDAAYTGATFTPLLGMLSLGANADGSRDVDVRFLIEAPHFVSDPAEPGRQVSEAGAGVRKAYTVSLLDHETFHDVSLDDILGTNGAAAGSITWPAGSGIGTPGVQGTIGGFGSHVPQQGIWGNALRLVFETSGDVGSLHLDTDEVMAPRIESIETAIQTTMGIPPRSANAAHAGSDLGDYAHYVIDTSDGNAGNPGMVPSGWAGSLIVGPQGASPAMTWTRTPDPADATQVSLIGRVEHDSRYDETEDAVSMIGGLSDHGLPPSATITAIETINNAGPAAQWNTCLLVVGVRDAFGQGGIYFWYAESFHRMSQAMPVDHLARFTDTAGDTLYAAGPHGVYRHTFNFSSIGAGDPWPPTSGVKAWDHIGGNPSATPPTTGLAYAVTRVVVDGPSGAPLIWAWVDKAVKDGGGIYVHPVASWDTANEGFHAGYDTWQKRVAASGIISFSYHATDDELLVAYKADAANVRRVGSVTSSATAEASPIYLTTPNKAAITGMFRVSGGTVITTTAGAQGLYLLPPGASVMTDLNADATLVDRAGNPVMVNKVVGHTGSVAGQAVALLACTDAGLFYSASSTGGGWTSFDAQNGLEGTNITDVACGQPVTIITGRTACRLWAVSAGAFYVSASDGMYFDDEQAARVSLAAHFAAVAKEAIGHYPASTVAAFYTSQPASPEYGTPGTGTQIHAGSVYNLPANLAWVSPTDGRNRRTYRLVNLVPTSPYGVFHAGQLSEITANAATSVAVTSGRLAAQHVVRQVSYARRRSVVSGQSAFNTSESVLRQGRPMQQILLTVEDVGMHFNAATFYILTYRIYKQRGEAFYRVAATFSTSLRDMPLPDYVLGGEAIKGVGRGRRFARG